MPGTPADPVPSGSTLELAVLRYRVDAEDVIVDLGEGFERFAAENGASGLAGRVMGTAIWSQLQGEEVIHLYRDLLRACRGSGRAVEFPFRCDSPTLRRYMRMRMVAAPDGSVTFESALLREVPRDAVELPPSGGGPQDAMLVVCAWCRQVEVEAGAWVELEEALRRLGLFGRETPWRISHGICPSCYRAVCEAERPSGGAPGPT